MLPSPGAPPTPEPLPSTEPPLAWVLLRHDLPDHSWHLDWLIERPDLTPAQRTDPDHPSLLAWRLPAALGDHWRPFGPNRSSAQTPTSPPPVLAQRLPDHRRVYLTYQGPISRNRGEVRRLASGSVRFFTLTPDRIDFQILPIAQAASSADALPVRWLAARLESSDTWSILPTE